MTYCVRILLSLATCVGLTATAFGQGTYTWNASQSGGTGGTGTAWMRNAGLGIGNGENWTGGTAGKMPGLDNNTNSIIDGTATDVAIYSTIANVTSVIGMSNSTNNGVGANAAANGRLQVGGVSNVSAGGFALTLNASSVAPVPPGILQLNGAYAGNTGGLAANTVLSATGGNITIDRGTTNLLDVELGVDAILTAATNRTISITSNVGQTGGTRALTKDGAGALTLSGLNTYAGTTTINGGTLNANTVTAGANSATGTGAIAVNNGGTLAGTGSALGAVAVNSGGRISSGNGAVNQTLSINSLTLDANSFLRSTVTGTGGTADNGLAGASRTAMTGPLEVTPAFLGGVGPITVELNGSAASFTPGQQYTRTISSFVGIGPNLQTAFGGGTGGTITPGNGVNLTAIGFAIDPVSWSINLNVASSGLLVVNFTPVPEPATVLGLAAFGAVAVGGLRRRFAKTV